MRKKILVTVFGSMCGACLAILAVVSCQTSSNPPDLSAATSDLAGAAGGKLPPPFYPPVHPIHIYDLSVSADLSHGPLDFANTAPAHFPDLSGDTAPEAPDMTSRVPACVPFGSSCSIVSSACCPSDIGVMSCVQQLSLNTPACCSVWTSTACTGGQHADCQNCGSSSVCGPCH